MVVVMEAGHRPDCACACRDKFVHRVTQPATLPEQNERRIVGASGNVGNASTAPLVSRTGRGELGGSIRRFRSAIVAGDAADARITH